MPIPSPSATPCFANRVLQKITAPLPEKPNQLLNLLEEVHNAASSIRWEANSLQVKYADYFKLLCDTRSQAKSLERLREELLSIRNPKAKLRITSDNKLKGGVHWLKQLLAPKVYIKQRERACAEFEEKGVTAGTLLPRVDKALSSVRYDLMVLNAELAKPKAKLEQYSNDLRLLKWFEDYIDQEHFNVTGRGAISPAQHRNLLSLPYGDPQRHEGRGGM